MKTAEEYWTDEFYRYALMIRDEKINQMDKTRNTEQGDANILSNCGTDILVSCNNNSNLSPNS